eukprot:GHVT01024031.1.p2 GENE.GHVT01024031.1~~GHVT01024031.1.p2  ORF type:complete len:110 (-),score=4.68 GHVT01024031.1:5-334(-)
MHRKTRKQHTPNRTEEASDPMTAVGGLIKLRLECFFPAFLICVFAKRNDNIRLGKTPIDDIGPIADLGAPGDVGAISVGYPENTSDDRLINKYLNTVSGLVNKKNTCSA